MKYSKYIENRCIYQNTKLFKKIEGISYFKIIRRLNYNSLLHVRFFLLTNFVFIQI